RDGRRRRLRLRREPHERDLLEPVARGEVPEGGVAGDDRPPVAAAKAARELAVERAEPPDERLGTCLVAEGCRDCPGHLRVAPRIEPDMRVDVVARAAEAEADVV